MKLFCVHCGYYMEKEHFRAFENHTVLFVVAENMKEAKQKVKQKDVFKKYDMHVDGIVALDEVDGFKIELKPSSSKNDSNQSWNYDEINE